MEFINGGLAGAGATIFTNPIDVAKIRLQLQGELKSRADTKMNYRGTFHALYVIAKTDGLMALQKGLLPAMVLGFYMNGVRLGIYKVAENKGWTKNKEGDISILKALFWSGAGGVVGGIVGNPPSVVKTRLQAVSHPSIAVGRQHRYNGMIDGLTQIYKTEGVKGFFAGTTATCTRLCVGSAAQLTTFSKAKEALLSYGLCKTSPVGLAFSASALSGAVVALAVCPLDVMTIRMYNQGTGDKNKVLYTGVLDCLTKIYTTEGIFGLYKGLGPLYLRLAPHTTLSLIIWDMLNDLFK